MNYKEEIQKYSWDWLYEELPEMKGRTQVTLPAYVDMNYFVNGRDFQENNSDEDKRLVYAYWYYKEFHDKLESESPLLRPVIKALHSFLIRPLYKYKDVYWAGVRLCNYHYAFWLSMPKEDRYDIDNGHERFCFMVSYYTNYREKILIDELDGDRISVVTPLPGHLDQITPQLQLHYWVYIVGKSQEDILADEVGAAKEFVRNIVRADTYILENEKPYYQRPVGNKLQADFRAPIVREDLKAGVNILGYPKAELGLGEYTRTLALSIEEKVKNVCVYDLNPPTSNHPSMINTVDHLISDKLLHEINIINTPPIIVPAILFEKGVQAFQNKYNIGYWAWEFSTWKDEHNYCFYPIQEVWTISSFLKECFEKNIDKPVIHMPLPVTISPFPKQSKSYFGIPEDKFMFLFTFDFNSKMMRKNPIGAINAFKEAFKENEDVILTIKVMYSNEDDPEWKTFKQLVDSDKRIFLIDKVLSKNDFYALIDCSDAFLSLHRSEGFGLCIAEAMLLKVPCIVTNYSGSSDFSNSETAFLVDYDLVKVKKGEYLYAEGLEWAEPRIDSAVSQMRVVFNGGDQVQAKVKKAHDNISAHFSIEACSRRYLRRLSEIGLSFNL